MVDEIDCFVLCLGILLLLKNFAMLYVGGVALTVAIPISILGCFTPWPKTITCSTRVTRFDSKTLIVIINMVLILAYYSP